MSQLADDVVDDIVDDMFERMLKQVQIDRGLIYGELRDIIFDKNIKRIEFTRDGVTKVFKLVDESAE